MSEDQTESLKGSTTNPVSFEDFVRQQFKLINKHIDRLETVLRTEMTEHSVQFSQQEMKTGEELCEGKDTEPHSEMSDFNERLRLLDRKLDVFIRENIKVKQELRELRELLNLEDNVAA